MGWRIYFMKYPPDGASEARCIDEVVCDGYEETAVGVKLFKLEPDDLFSPVPTFILQSRTDFSWWERFTGVHHDPLGSQRLVRDDSPRPRFRKVHFTTISSHSFDYYKVVAFERAAP